MSNTLPTSSPSIREKKDLYLSLIAAGQVESDALLAADLSKATYIRLLLDDSDFTKAVEVARKHRAEHWVAKIAKDHDTHYDKDETPGAKLIFDKLQYLAKADNPERYGSSAKGANININLGEFKLLTPEDAKRVLASDPFAIIDAEFVVDEDSSESDQELL